MEKPTPMAGTALAVGVIAVLLIAVGVFIALFGEESTSSVSSGVLIRVGAVLGGVALVLPGIRRPSLTTVAVATGGALLVLARPALIWVALVGWVVWLVLGGQRNSPDSES